MNKEFTEKFSSLFSPITQFIQEEKNLFLEKMTGGAKALAISELQKISKKSVLVIGESEELCLFHDLATFTDSPVVEFPAWETLPSETIAPSSDTTGQRYDVLQKITYKPHIILAPLSAVLQKLIAPKQFSNLTITLTVGQTFSFSELKTQLHSMGYIRNALTSDKGSYAVRGGIIDVFPVHLPDAYRIEFWGDEIASIRVFDPVGQKSIRPVETVTLTAAVELELVQQSDTMASVLDYLQNNCWIVFDDLVKIEDRYAELKKTLSKPLQTFFSFQDFFTLSQQCPHLYLSEYPLEQIGAQIEKLSSEIQHATLTLFSEELKGLRWYHPFEPASLEADRVICLVADDREKKSFLEILQEKEDPLPDELLWEKGYLSSGFTVWGTSSTTVLPFAQLTERYRLRRPLLRSTYHTTPTPVHDLQTGDHVVHLSNGIGRFIGIEKKQNHLGVEGEYFLLEYADKGKLYVPADQAHMVSKYIGATESTSVKLHKLGSSRWQRTRQATEKAIMGYAADLLDTYAKREIKGGFAYPEDSDLMCSFEDSFPYTETADQIRAIADVKEDMKAEKATDRLICGDVGYGKTEVALRAAFKAAVDGGKQVAILVPTTVLALQHYENFSERMAPFPVHVACLSRTAGAKATKKIIDGLSNGSVDIVIGTHRLISKDIVFKDLGLIIIDEEQRFGVRAKEHLKSCKSGVDCLTLTATPIPRTLYLSLMGARDLSTIATPPQDRLPIQTVISESNTQQIRSALIRELARNGQSYVIHNRVETIYDYAASIRKMVPQAKVIVGHGQMSTEEMRQVFHTFKMGQADILVATSIVENGIDIPNANTIIIDRADRFGLSDLYQLRGRVGRWRRKAYAYLLAPKHKMRDEIVAKRLHALAQVSGYGGGMQLAMHDLEIRGAGNILGVEQSGQVSAVGFHLYCKMLKRTIEALQGKLPHGIIDTKIEIPLDAKLPESYVNEQVLRMEIYQRLGEALTTEEVDQLLSECKDRFGPLPLEAKRLFHLTRIRVFACRKGVISAKLHKGTLTIERKQGAKVKTQQIPFSLPKKPEQMEKTFIKALNP